MPFEPMTFLVRDILLSDIHHGVPSLVIGDLTRGPLTPSLPLSAIV
jgi:hypothetical protein